MRIVTVVGNRPQFVKAAAVSGPLRGRHEEVLVHTGQHYDEEMSSVFFAELGLPAPDHELAVNLAVNADGGRPAGNTAQTAAMLGALAPVLADVRPDVVLVYGDTNSTLAGGLAAAQAAIPVAHVEAGMRSFDRRMPEELNRVLTDHLATLLLCPSAVAANTLEHEGIAAAVETVGDVMVDVARLLAPAVRSRSGVLDRLGVTSGDFLLATAHRAGTVDDPARLEQLVDLLAGLSEPVVLPLHPRTRERLERFGLAARLGGGVRICDPLGYLDFAALLHHARAVLTDSGGVQKEAYLAGVPCVTLRDTTEWVETVQHGWNVLVDLDPAAARTALAGSPPGERPEVYGDGHAGERVVAALERYFGAA